MNVDPSGLIYRIAVIYGRYDKPSIYKLPNTLCEFITSFVRGLLLIFAIIAGSSILGIVLLEPIMSTIMHNMFSGDYAFFGPDSKSFGTLGVGGLFFIGFTIWLMIILLSLGALISQLPNFEWFQNLKWTIKHTTIPLDIKKPSAPKILTSFFQNVSDVYSAITGKMCVHMNYYEKDNKGVIKNENQEK